MNYARSIPEVFTDLIRQLATLVRTEALLARAEISEKIGLVAVGLGLIIGGAILVMPGLIVLLEAGVAALVNAGFATYWAALIVGGGVVLIGLILLAAGVAFIKAERLVPTKTIEQLQQDANVARQQVRNDDDTTQRAA